MRIHEVELVDFDRVMAVNVRSCYVTSRLVIPFMLKQALRPDFTPGGETKEISSGLTHRGEIVH